MRGARIKLGKDAWVICDILFFGKNSQRTGSIHIKLESGNLKCFERSIGVDRRMIH